MRALAWAAVVAFGIAAASAQQDAASGKPPNMPAHIEALFRANNSEINPDSRCDVIDWVVRSDSGMPAEAIRLARRQVDICVLPHDGITAAAAARRLGAEALGIYVDGGELTVLAKSSANAVIVCCAPQMQLARIGSSNYWVARRRIAAADRAMLTLAMIEPGKPISEEGWRSYRGPNAPPRPPETEIGEWKGQMLERALKSPALGETRKLMIYLPPGHSKDRAWPALFMADAGAVEFAGLVEKMVEAGEMAPIVIVSADSGEDAVLGPAPTQYGGELRSADYLRFWPQGGDRFDRHMEFFAKEMVDYAVATFGVSPRREDRAVSGKSSGGVLAMWAGLMRADTFAHAVPMSPGYLTLKPEHLSGGQRAQFFLSGGMYEPPFIAAAKAAEETLRTGGYDVTGRYYSAGHYHDQWAVALREALKEIFPPR
jgi:enterochelin esterase-like enzyme